MKALKKNSIINHKIVLKRFGRKNRAFFKILVLNSMHKYCACLGSADIYNNNKKLNNFFVNKQFLYFWLYKGAKPSFSVLMLLRFLLV